VVEARIIQLLVDAGATPVSAARAAYVLVNGGSVADAEAEIVMAEVFRPEMLISRVNGGGGNRTRVRSRTEEASTSIGGT
jgi:hypothetical protein